SSMISIGALYFISSNTWCLKSSTSAKSRDKSPDTSSTLIFTKLNASSSNSEASRFFLKTVSNVDKPLSLIPNNPYFSLAYYQNLLGWIVQQFGWHILTVPLQLRFVHNQLK